MQVTYTIMLWTEKLRVQNNIRLTKLLVSCVFSSIQPVCKAVISQHVFLTCDVGSIRHARTHTWYLSRIWTGGTPLSKDHTYYLSTFVSTTAACNTQPPPSHVISKAQEMRIVETRWWGEGIAYSNRFCLTDTNTDAAEMYLEITESFVNVQN
jgi:hypothetical protein